VRQDKLREVKAGHDGTWVAHPGLVPIAKADLRRTHEDAESDHVKREDVTITAKDLVAVPRGPITEAGFALEHVDVGIAVSGIVAARQRLRAHLQPDGRRGDGRRFRAYAGVAVAPIPSLFSATTSGRLDLPAIRACWAKRSRSMALRSPSSA
jgi:hypothetical protein